MNEEHTLMVLPVRVYSSKFHRKTGYASKFPQRHSFIRQQLKLHPAKRKITKSCTPYEKPSPPSCSEPRGRPTTVRTNHQPQGPVFSMQAPKAVVCVAFRLSAPDSGAGRKILVGGVRLVERQMIRTSAWLLYHAKWIRPCERQSELPIGVKDTRC